RGSQVATMRLPWWVQPHKGGPGGCANTRDPGPRSLTRRDLVNSVLADPDDTAQPMPGGGWLSGSPTAPAPGPSTDRRPEFNPAFLAAEVLRLLREHKIHVDPTPGQRYAAEIACADVLRAVGVNPASSPRRPQ